MGGELLVRWTARIAVACYIARLLCDTSSKEWTDSQKRARIFWSVGCVVFLLHVIAAFHFIHNWRHAAAFEAIGAPAGIARRAAALETQAAAGDLMQAARANGCSIDEAARLYFRLGERLSLAPLATAAQNLPRDGQWPAQAALAMQDELAALQADLLASALRSAGPEGAVDADAVLTRWSAQRKLALDRVDRIVKEDLPSTGVLDLAMLSVATSELRGLI